MFSGCNDLLVLARNLPDVSPLFTSVEPLKIVLLPVWNGDKFSVQRLYIVKNLAVQSVQLHVFLLLIVQLVMIDYLHKSHILFSACVSYGFCFIAPCACLFVLFLLSTLCLLSRHLKQECKWHYYYYYYYYYHYYFITYLQGIYNYTCTWNKPCFYGIWYCNCSLFKIGAT